MTIDDPTPGSGSLVFSGRLFEVWQWDAVLFDGTVATFEAVRRPDTVYVIPVADSIATMAWRRQPGQPPALGFFGGRVEVDEAPIEAAQRELREEAGLVPTALHHWFSIQFSPKIMWVSHVYLASGCNRAADLEADPGEDLYPTERSFDDLLATASDENFAHTDLAAPLLRIAHDPARRAEAYALLSRAG